MTPVLAIDPGTTESQFVIWNGSAVLDLGFLPNTQLLADIPGLLSAWHPSVCIEGVACYGMAVGKEVFDTCIWIGRFYQQCEGLNCHPAILYRMAVKMHLCHNTRAKDPNIRQAIIDRFGGKVPAIGNKKSPGPLYGIASHAWSALALAITHHDQSRVGLLPLCR